MKIRLVVSINAAPGKGAELAQASGSAAPTSQRNPAASSSRYFRVC